METFISDKSPAHALKSTAVDATSVELMTSTSNNPSCSYRCLLM